MDWRIGAPCTEGNASCLAQFHSRSWSRPTVSESERGCAATSFAARAPRPLVAKTRPIPENKHACPHIHRPARSRPIILAGEERRPTGPVVTMRFSHTACCVAGGSESERENGEGNRSERRQTQGAPSQTSKRGAAHAVFALSAVRLCGRACRDTPRGAGKLRTEQRHSTCEHTHKKRDSARARAQQPMRMSAGLHEERETPASLGLRA